MKFSFEDIDKLERDPNYELKELDLSSSNTGIEEIERLSKSTLVEKIQILKLDGLKLGDELINTLFKAFDFENLVEISLSSNHITDIGVESLITKVESKKLPKLKKINLRRNNIGSKGAKMLYECTFPARIEYLNLDYNEAIGRKGRELLYEKFGDALN